MYLQISDVEDVSVSLSKKRLFNSKLGRPSVCCVCAVADIQYNVKGVPFNLLKSNDIYIYICHTAALTSRRYILYIYSTNIHTEYFKHAA